MLFQTEAGMILSFFIAYLDTQSPRKKSVSPTIPGELSVFDFTQGSRSSPLFTGGLHKLMMGSCIQVAIIS